MNDTLDEMQRLRPVLVTFDSRMTTEAWNRLLSGHGEKYMRKIFKQPAAHQLIGWEDQPWVKPEVEINPSKGIFSSILYALRHTHDIKLFGCDMEGQGYNSETEPKPQKWSKRWPEERKTMAKMYLAMKRRGYRMSGLPQSFLEEFKLV